MSCCELVFNVYNGDDVSQLMQVSGDGLPINLSTVEDISVTLPNDPSQAALTQTFNIGNSGIVIVNPVIGTFNLVMTSTQTAALLAVNSGNLDVVVTDSLGKLKTYRCPNSLNVLQRVA